MKAGLAVFPTPETPPPAQIARLAESRGFESLWFPEHTHIPASRQTPYPAGGELPPEYARTYDLFVALAMAAAATERILLGTGVCLVIERDPIITAKAAASIDALSGGRLLFGVGVGWNREEMANHGTDYRTRMSLARERVEAIKTIWTQDEASYSGRFVDFDPIWCWPKPARTPPVLVGGNGPSVDERVLTYGDAWMPNAMRGSDEDILARWRALREHKDVGLTLYAASTKPERLAALERAGVERVVFFLGQNPDEWDARLARIEGAMP